ncbi:MAG: dipicolinate synthase subunit DpsA [Oscillospiraceae bacterium]|nr:dipicolinate synthase subunit DpsA [Oscillospiraceae bacterium]
MLKKYLIAGGDLRYVTLAEALAGKNSVYAAGFDKNVIFSKKVTLIKSLASLKERVDYIILPIPATNDGVTVNTPFSGNSIPLGGLTSIIKEGGIVFGGRITEEMNALFKSCGIKVEDYSAREEFAVMNAVATGEGAIQVAMEETASTLSSQKILIIGMGRIAKTIIRQLSGFGAEVAVAARKYHDLAWAEIFGCSHIHIDDLGSFLGSFDIIFNTVPAMLLDEKMLKTLNKNCLIIDLASKPGGVDFDTAGRLGVKTIWLLSLPGKVAPLTSGKIIAQTIENILNERGAEPVPEE